MIRFTILVLHGVGSRRSSLTGRPWQASLGTSRRRRVARIGCSDCRDKADWNPSLPTERRMSPSPKERGRPSRRRVTSESIGKLLRLQVSVGRVQKTEALTLPSRCIGRSVAYDGQRNLAAESDVSSRLAASLTGPVCPRAWAVYLADDLRYDRLVALKVPKRRTRPSPASNGPFAAIETTVLIALAREKLLFSRKNYRNS